MSRRAVCNQCGVEVELNEYGLTPAGWLTLAISGPPYVPPVDLCGVSCAIATLTLKEGT
jgi:hypothetical protein